MRALSCAIAAASLAASLSACVPMGEIHDRTAMQEREGADVTRFGDVAFRKIAPDVWQHTTYLDLPGIGPVPSNGLLVVDGEETLLVDTAWTDPQTSQILAWADGVLGKPVRAAIITHAHKDKMGGIAAVHQADIATYAHPLTNADAPANGFEPARHDLVFGADGWLSNPQADNFVPLAIYYPGGAHTRDNITVGIPAARVAFGGCMIKGTDSKTLGNLADANTEAYAQSARNFAAAFPGFEIVAMSHSQPEGREAIAHTVELAEKL